MALAILVPSVYMFYQLYKQSDFDQKVDALIEELKTEKGVLILDVKKDYSKRQINFAVIGKSLSEKEVKEFEQKMTQLGYANCEFKVFQDNGSIETMTKMKDIEQSFLSNQQLLVKKDADLLDKDRQIFDLKNQLTAKKATIMSFDQITKEMKALDATIEEVSYAEKLVTNFSKVDTIPTFEIKWNTKVGTKTKAETAQKLENWLKTKLKIKKMEVKVD